LPGNPGPPEGGPALAAVFVAGIGDLPQGRAAGLVGRADPNHESDTRGVAVHDAWAPYDTYVDAEHQVCCAHYPDLRIIPTSV
jgi:hypothetical protein